VVELIKKGTTILQLCFAKHCKHKNAYNNTMATCDMPPLKGPTSCSPFALYKLAIISVVDIKGGLFFLKGCWMVTTWTK
jgi:hypothetical protein